MQYFNDYITNTTSNKCGTYSIDVKFNSDSSTIEGGPVDALLTSLVVLDDSSLEFYSNQPGLSGVLKYDVKIVSTDFTESSPIAVWTLNLLTCD